MDGGIVVVAVDHFTVGVDVHDAIFVVVALLDLLPCVLVGAGVGLVAGVLVGLACELVLERRSTTVTVVDHCQGRLGNLSQIGSTRVSERHDGQCGQKQSESLHGLLHAFPETGDFVYQLCFTDHSMKHNYVSPPVSGYFLELT